MNFHRIKTSRAVISLLWLVFIFQTEILPQPRKADLVIVNAAVYTIDAKKPRASAIAVAGNKISAVGTTEEIKKLVGARTKTIDAGGRAVIPGFNDAHVHFLGMGNQFSSIDLRDAKSPAEMVEKIKYHAQFLPPGRWILGGDWNHENWSPAALPTKDLIDAATPANPVFIYRAGAKTALANSLALRLARIDRNAGEIKSGEIMLDASGEPNGILSGAAMNSVKSLTPASNTADRLAVVEAATNYAAFYGVTSVQDMSADDNRGVFAALEREGKLKTRIYDCLNLLGWQTNAPPVLPREPAASMIRGGCLKGFSEGDGDEIPDLYRRVRAADRGGWQVMIHAIGARANENALSVFERVARENRSRDRRFRIEHAHNFKSEDAARFGKTKIIASVQPALFADANGAGSEPLQSLMRSNTPLAFGSDSSMIPINPLDGIYAASTSRLSGQSVAVEEAVRFYTLGAAYAEFQENVKGSLTIGKLADLVILSKDIFTIKTDEIRGTKVLLTIVDGRVVYEARN